MVVKSILDTDLYKFTTSYAYMKLFPNAEGTFSFIDRDNTEYDEEFILMLNMELLNLYSLSLSIEEKDYMIANCRFIPAVYWEWLSSFKFDPSRVVISLDENKHLNIDVTDSLYKVTLYEVPILAIVSEVRNAWLSNTPDSNWKQRLYDKVQMSNQHALPFSEFGTRRRFSYEVQESVCIYLKRYATFCTGTSNCYLAMKCSMKMMGTHPHEWFMFHDAQPGSISVGTGNDRGGEEDEVEAIGWIPLDSIDKYQWAFDHDKIIREFAEWMHLEDGDLDMEDIDLDPV